MENRFVENITNEAIATLPACGFDGQITVVDSAKDIDAACEYLSRFEVIGFDTETRPTFKPGALNKVALLQLSTPERCYLFRLCKIPLERQIIRLLEDPAILKIGADVKGDLRALNQLRHFKPGGFVDLQSEVWQWGIADKSVRKMTGIVLGQRVSKAQRLSNWEAAALTDAQCMYAATDAWICLKIWERLGETDRKPLPHHSPPPAATEKKKPKRRKKQ